MKTKTLFVLQKPMVKTTIHHATRKSAGRINANPLALGNPLPRIY
jgi:hypothetical protein